MTAPLPPERIQEIKALAEKATPDGPWYPGAQDDGVWTGPDMSGDLIVNCEFEGSDGLTEPWDVIAARTRYLAALDPQTVFALIAAKEAAEAALASMALRTEAAELALRGDQWQSMETAPRDGTPVIVAVLLSDQSKTVVGEAQFEDCGPHDNATGWWWAGESPGDEHAEPIASWHFPPHLWQPLPAPRALRQSDARDG